MSECTNAVGHCGHSTGTGVTLASQTGGHEDFKCCHCGATVHVPWRRVKEPLGFPHGEHVTTSRRLYDWPEGWS